MPQDEPRPETRMELRDWTGAGTPIALCIGTLSVSAWLSFAYRNPEWLAGRICGGVSFCSARNPTVRPGILSLRELTKPRRARLTIHAPQKKCSPGPRLRHERNPRHFFW